MAELESIKNRCIRAILEVNDLGSDQKQKSAMRAIVMTAVNTAFHEVKNATGDTKARSSTGRRVKEYNSRN